MIREADRDIINHLFSAETVEELETLEESLRESGDLVSWIAALKETVARDGEFVDDPKETVARDGEIRETDG